ncbi:uncharacterized protein LOC110453251 isoform X3 [Mizuhopecten yessoensis]|uniref:uncharacterized protein LOC110453251 isoform X3 n=1 Tax=Mizuhopecten yessoensis TaxID=6573 RepID=UPI000B45CE3E|nr:uncharacterized protein LOC110453251 isoform X3 [Mizuhopecten yessoensis]
MASASGFKSSLTGSKANRWLLDLTDELGGNVAEFASHIGFTESQVKVIQEPGQHLHQLVISKWLDTIGHHTTKYQHVVYTALVTLKRQDLLDKYFKGGTPEKYSDDIWEDFIKELHAIDFNNLESREPGQDKKPDVTKKKKKKNRNEQKEKIKEKVIERDREKMILADDTTLPGNPQIDPSAAGNKQKEMVKEKVKEKDREKVILADDTSLPGNPQIVPSADKKPDVSKKRKKNSRRTRTKSSDGNGQTEKVKERDTEKVLLEDDTTSPCNSQTVLSAGNEQTEKVKERDTHKVLLEGDTTLPGHPQIVPYAGNKQTEKVKERDNVNVLLEDDANSPCNSQTVLSAGNEQTEKVKERDTHKVLLEGDTTLPGHPQIVPYAGNKQKEKVKERDNVNVLLEDDATTSCNSQTVLSAENEQKEKVKEKDSEKVLLEDDITLPVYPQIVPSTGNEQTEKVKERDTEKVSLEGDTTLTGNPKIVSSAESVKEKNSDKVTLADDDSLPSNPQVVHSADKNKTATKKKKSPTKGKAKQDIVYQTTIYAGGNVIVGDSNAMVFEATPSTDVPHKKIRQQLHDILKANGSVGGNPKVNTMQLQKLESCFNQRHGKSFKSVYDNSLLTYLEQSKEVFVLRMLGDQWFVHMRDISNTPNSGSNTHVSNEDSLKTNKTKDSPKNNPSALIRPTLDHSQKREHIPNKCTAFNDFLKFVDNFRGGRYLLLISKTDFSRNVDALANIPWLCVFDFDVDSRTDGLFYRVEDVFRKQGKGLYPCTWFDPPNIQTFGTEWCFISGVTKEPESKTPDSFKLWYPHIKKRIEQHVDKINEMLDTVSVLTVVACWPEDRATGLKFQKIISALNESIAPAPKVVVIGIPPAEHQSLIDEMISPNYHLKEKLDHVFHDLSTNLGPQQDNSLTYRLPTDDGTTVTRINDTSAASFRESMQILYLDNPSQSSSSDMSASEEEERLFFKGGTLSWQSYYTDGPEHFYVARDLLPTIVNDIKCNFIDTLNQGFVKIFHAPGAGGTTIGQNILWNLHEITPCVQIRTDSLAKPQQIAENISVLYKETHSPIVVLFDGSDKNKFEQIQQQLHHVIVVFIYLERVSETKINLDKHEYFLKGTLSKGEARRMGPKFIRCCHDNVKKKDQIQKLVDGVEKGVNHHLVEFGLVIHLQEFKGVAKYVAEYLKVDIKSKELNKNQRVLGYLSLVKFYGQGTMPCQMFGTLLGRSADYKFTYDKFPASIKEFTVPVESGFVQNSVRICHFLIAREILDQILSRVLTCNQGLNLSPLAKNHLQPFVLEFIKDLKTRQDQTGQKSKTMLDIIIQTFIYREGGADDTQLKKRQFSRLIESIPSEQPFTERLRVMETLAESFPFISSLWAHLGRAYSLLCPTQHEKTETFFQEAIKGCQAKESHTDSENDDFVPSFVYHMYGMFYLQRIKAEIAKCRKQDNSEMQFQDAVRNMFILANTACKAFSDCRKFGYAGCQESFGCIGEINVRLCICDLLKSHYHFDTIQALREKSRNANIILFVEESLSNIQHLFMKCFNTVDQSHIDKQFYRKVTNYNMLFKGMIQTNYLATLSVPDTFHTRCATIVGMKLKYGEVNRLGTINDIKDERDIKFIITMLEKNIDDIRQPGEQYSNMDVDFVFIDWIQAIRHPQQKTSYSLEDVLTNVRFWHKNICSPYSIFYLFVLLCTLSIHSRRSCDVNILKEAMAIKRAEMEMKQIGKQFSNQGKPREWLGKESGIRCIERGSTYQNYIKGKVINDEAASYTLVVLTGTIQPPNTYRQHGSLKLYVEGNTDVQVKVPFCPFKTGENLVGSKYAGFRVEFVLAFTAQLGFEAYNVKLLKKSTCKSCGAQVEIVSVERHKVCRCKEMVENEFPYNTANKPKAEEHQNK